MPKPSSVLLLGLLCLPHLAFSEVRPKACPRALIQTIDIPTAVDLKWHAPLHDQILALVRKTYAGQPEHAALFASPNEAKVFFLSTTYPARFDFFSSDITIPSPSRKRVGFSNAFAQTLRSLHLVGQKLSVPASPNSWYHQLKSATFAVRVPGLQYRLHVVPLPKTGKLRANVLNAKNSGIAISASGEEAWFVDGYDRISEPLLRTTVKSRGVRQFDKAKDFFAQVPPTVASRIRAYNVRLEAVGGPMFGGHLLSSDDDHFGASVSDPRYYQVRDPLNGELLGYLVEVQTTLYSEVEGLTRTAHETLSKANTFSHVAYFDPDGIRVDLWQEGPLRFPQGQLVSSSRTTQREPTAWPRQPMTIEQVDDYLPSTTPNPAHYKALPANGVLPVTWADLVPTSLNPASRESRWRSGPVHLGKAIDREWGQSVWSKARAYRPFTTFGLFPEDMEATLSPNGRWAFNLNGSVTDLHRATRLTTKFNVADAIASHTSAKFSFKGDILYLAGSIYGDGTETIRAFDPLNGKPIWSENLPPLSGQRTIISELGLFGSNRFLFTRRRAPAHDTLPGPPVGTFYFDRTTRDTKQLTKDLALWGVSGAGVFVGDVVRGVKMLRYETGENGLEFRELNSAHADEANYFQASPSGDHFWKRQSRDSLQSSLWRFTEDGTLQELFEYPLTALVKHSQKRMVEPLSDNSFVSSDVQSDGSSYLAVPAIGIEVPRIYRFDEAGQITGQFDLTELAEGRAESRSIWPHVFAFFPGGHLLAIAHEHSLSIVALRGTSPPEVLRTVRNLNGGVAQALQFSADGSSVILISRNGGTIQRVYVE